MGWKNGQRKIVVAALAACVLTSAWFTSAGTAQEPGRRIGVVDLQTVFEKYEKKTAYTVELNDLGKRKETVLKEIQKQAETMQQALEMLRPGSEELEARTAALRSKRVELVVQTKVAELELQYKNQEFMKEIYKDIEDEVQLFGSEGHYDLIVKTEQVELNVPNMDLLTAQIDKHKVLYYSPGIDCTEKILDRLNKKWAKRR